MGFLSTFAAVAKGELADLSLDPTTSTSSPSALATSSGPSSTSAPAPSAYRASKVARDIALSIPAVRRARHIIVGTPSTFTLSAWAGDTQLAATDPRASWLRQPMPGRTLMWAIAKTLDDGLWHDRSVWAADPDIAGRWTRFSRVHPSRVTTIANSHDPDEVDGWVKDGTLYSDAEFRAKHLVFDFAGLGGLDRFGAQLLDLYADLQVAAGNYAKAPHPKAILKHHGPDLEDEEIDALLEKWSYRRDTSSVGFLNDALDYEVTDGWNPEQLQLVQSREHSALEVARLFALPAKAVDAKGGDSLTYATLVEYRRDILESIRPWMSVLTQTLSMDERSSRPSGLVLPLGIRAEFDTAEYLRDTPLTRMQTWQAALSGDNPILTLDEVRALEPFARSTNAR